MKKLFTKEIKIAVSAIVAVAAVVFGINYLKGINLFKPTSYFYVKITNARQLTVSSPVFADGFKIGLVRHIDYDYQHPGNIVVEIGLDEHTRIPKGSWAELETEMLGGVSMNIVLAKDSHESHAVGDTIPGIERKGMMDNVAGMIPKVDKLLPKMDSILVSLNKILGDPNIPATLQSLQGMSANLNATSAQLSTLMKNDVPQIASNLNTVSENFVGISESLKEVDYQAMLAKLDTTLRNIETLTAKLNKEEGSMGLLLNNPELYNNLNATAANASKLLEDLKANPKRYVHFSLFGKKDKSQPKQ